jgi:hypothetical protein
VNPRGIILKEVENGMPEDEKRGWLIAAAILISIAVYITFYAAAVHAAETEGMPYETLQSDIQSILDEVQLLHGEAILAKEEMQLLRNDLSVITTEAEKVNFHLDMLMKFVFLVLVYIVIRALYRFISGMF